MPAIHSTATGSELPPIEPIIKRDEFGRPVLIIEPGGMTQTIFFYGSEVANQSCEQDNPT